MSVKRSTGAAEKKMKKRARKQEHKIRRSAFWHRLQAHLQKMTSHKKSVELETPRSEAQPSASHDFTFFLSFTKPRGNEGSLKKHLKRVLRAGGG